MRVSETMGLIYIEDFAKTYRLSSEHVQLITRISLKKKTKVAIARNPMKEFSQVRLGILEQESRTSNHSTVFIRDNC